MSHKSFTELFLCNNASAEHEEQKLSISVKELKNTDIRDCRQMM
jgi:hypothetical protein